MGKAKNNYRSKLRRTITSALPIQKGRKGSCMRCGKCCELPNPCIFLDYGRHNKPVCKIYMLRPLNCRKYPRSEREHITKKTCGFYFENDNTKI